MKESTEKEKDKEKSEKKRPQKQKGIKIKKTNIYDLNSFLNKKISIIFSGGRKIKGILKSYDTLENMILDDVEEIFANDKTRELGLTFNPKNEQLERDVKRHNEIINKLGFNIWDFVDNNNNSMSVNKDGKTICFLADGFYKQDYTLEELRRTIKQILNDYYNVVEELERRGK